MSANRKSLSCRMEGKMTKHMIIKGLLFWHFTKSLVVMLRVQEHITVFIYQEAFIWHFCHNKFYEGGGHLLEWRHIFKNIQYMQGILKAKYN